VLIYEPWRLHSDTTCCCWPCAAALLPPLLLPPQNAEYRFLSSLNVLNVVQSLIMFIGISAGVLACTAGVSRVRQHAALVLMLSALL
jgi:hypothetical protein